MVRRGVVWPGVWRGVCVADMGGVLLRLAADATLEISVDCVRRLRARTAC